VVRAYQLRSSPILFHSFYRGLEVIRYSLVMQRVFGYQLKLFFVFFLIRRLSVYKVVFKLNFMMIR